MLSLDDIAYGMMFAGGIVLLIASFTLGFLFGKFW
jgi:hypothetical protein